MTGITASGKTFAGYIHSAVAAEGLHWKHTKLIHGLNRVLSMLPPDFDKSHILRAKLVKNGREHRAYLIHRQALALLFLSEANKTEVQWTARAIQAGERHSARRCIITARPEVTHA